MNSEFGELGEFQIEYCLPEELADVFYEDNMISNEKTEVISKRGCINLMHYA